MLKNKKKKEEKSAPVQPIGREQIVKAAEILSGYKAGKTNLERRIVENQEWYKLRHWDCMRQKTKNAVEPCSAWLFNCIENKHADAMDNFPLPTILPREEADKDQANMLSAVVPVVLSQNNFEETYSAVWQDMLIGGTGVYGIFWDPAKLGGLGDISLCAMDPLTLFWEPGITDIQKSRHVFTVELTDNDLLLEQYPFLEGNLAGGGVEVQRYLYDDTVDTAGKSAVVDWYYKKQVGNKQVLHYCKFVGEQVLFATENQPETAGEGWYRHGQYPFVLNPLFPLKGTPAGFGYVDIGKNAQEYIDRGNQAILQNLLFNAKPRHFIVNGGAVNEEEYADVNNDFVHVDGGLGQDSVMPIPPNPLNGIYLDIIHGKIDELKETTGNRDVSTGGTVSGVTAASAIAAMQEAGSKLSRDHIKASYRAVSKVCLQVVELIRQFYDLPRQFRITGKGGYEYIEYVNTGLQPTPLEEDGLFGGYTMPLFDVEISVQKQSPYSRLSQNELALQFLNAGMFNPQMADQALACLDMMEFDRKAFVEKRIAQNASLQQQLDDLTGQVSRLQGLLGVGGQKEE